MKIQSYLFPESLSEAYDLLNERRTAAIVAGCGWLKLEGRTVSPAIDLSRLGLDAVTEKDGFLRLGSYCTLRQLEQSPVLRRAFGPFFAECVSPIVGVQFRNMATIGGSVYGRFGFSDLATALLCLETQMELYRAGSLPLEEFLRIPRSAPPDILVSLRLPADGRRAVIQSQRNSSTDLPVLNAAVSRLGDGWRIAVGARPGIARLAKQAACVAAQGAGAEETARAGARELSFGTNMRGGAAYRRSLAQTLIRRCIQRLEAEQ